MAILSSSAEMSLPERMALREGRSYWPVKIGLPHDYKCAKVTVFLGVLYIYSRHGVFDVKAAFRVWSAFYLKLTQVLLKNVKTIHHNENLNPGFFN